MIKSQRMLQKAEILITGCLQMSGCEERTVVPNVRMMSFQFVISGF